ncbi:LysR family transcriptional regulator [Leminorella grimontii]|uniref:LysR family transcriptional regulator n=1 Tax=Leminorella grimontii TaxID=82981 RepID=A0AAV5N779_9GAMM|nr:LysR family transcriptional regulator [Leminorella grimontii]KFC94500.1 transcriptional regulator [Leminorella grimontii ATCC 33999 = DSM 5078]GKX56596.1 LysR family transcriptional regulator [Leminorella grimontii]GKX59803.1 LysR family transcriptional regulator [Leminorella grimontii]VFS61714.1 HTH-type transcriptional regulator gltR [Leminorella grimontii]
MSFTLRQLEFFVTLADTGQISKAALRCNVSQSSMTVSLKNLEEQCERQLFTRHAKGIRLTSEGERLLRHARQILNSAQLAVADVRMPSNELQGPLRLGVTETLSAYMLPTLLSDIAARFPSLELELLELPSTPLFQAVENGDVDFAIMLISNITLPKRCETEIFFRSTRRLWTCAGHPLQNAPTITLKDVAQEDYLLLDMDDHIPIVNSYWGKQGLNPKVKFESRSIEAVRSMVALGLGVTILSDFVYRAWSLEGNRIIRRDVSNVIPSMDIGAVWMKDRPLSGQARMMIDFIRDQRIY